MAKTSRGPLLFVAALVVIAVAAVIALAVHGIGGAEPESTWRPSSRFAVAHFEPEEWTVDGKPVHVLGSMYVPFEHGVRYVVELRCTPGNCGRLIEGDAQRAREELAPIDHYVLEHKLHHRLTLRRGGKVAPVLAVVLVPVDQREQRIRNLVYPLNEPAMDATANDAAPVVDINADAGVPSGLR